MPSNLVSATESSWTSTVLTSRFLPFKQLAPNVCCRQSLALVQIWHLQFTQVMLVSHDVTKIQTAKLSILLRFYFHDVLEQLKNNFHTNFRFKRVLGFVIEYAWISKLLSEVGFTWRARGLSCRLKKYFYFGEFCYLNSSCIRKSITLMFMSFSKNKFTLL